MRIDPPPSSAASLGRGDGSPPTVVVVGAGVSGTACAATLADRGARVVLVSSALDIVGLPGYGPEIRSVDDTWHALLAAFTCLQPDLASAWLTGSLTTIAGPPLVVVDRRLVSSRLKWVLENLSGVEFRQGLVVEVEVRALGDAQIRVTTAFGEEFWGDACILAPGMALGGRMSIGEQCVAGGRYGEVPADGLHECLRGAGVPLTTRGVDVGARVRPPIHGGADHPHSWEDSGCPLQPLRDAPAAALFGELLARAHEPLLVAGGHEEAISAMREWEGRLPQRIAGPFHGGGAGESDLVTRARAQEPSGEGRTVKGASADGRAPVFAAAPAALPDGVATGEWYLAPGASLGPLAEAGWMVMRLPHRVEAHIVDLGPPSAGTSATSGPSLHDRPWVGGRLSSLPGVWVCGQVAGARGYAQSLVSGAMVAREVAAELGLSVSRGPVGSSLGPGDEGPSKEGGAR